MGEISQGFYESTEARLLPLLVRPEDSVLELGAGLGFIAALLMTQCRPRAYCAIEADARLIPLIQKTLDLNDVRGEFEVRNAILTEDAEKLRDQVNTGGQLSDVIATCEYFPSFTRRMIAAGEEAAELPKMCEIISRNYDREGEYLTKNISTAIEPVMVVGLAGVVLLIALAIFLPMWNMAAVIG